MAAAPELIRACTVFKQCTDVHTPNLNQAIIDYYLRNNLLQGHVGAIVPKYSELMHAMMDELPRLPGVTNYTKPDGGLFIFVVLDKALDAFSLFQSAINKGLAFVPGEHFYVQGGHKNTIRLNFSGTDLDGIKRGMTILKDCLHGMM